MALDVIEMRDYARTKRDIKQSEDKKDHPFGPMTDKVYAIEAEIAERRRKEG